MLHSYSNLLEWRQILSPKGNKCSQFLTLGNESISVALLTTVNISCSVLCCHFNGRTPKAD